jgi:hypothetical protein
MTDIAGAIRLPSHEESIGPVTILDGQGIVVRVVPAEEFRRLQPSSLEPSHARVSALRERRRAELPKPAGLKERPVEALAG